MNRSDIEGGVITRSSNFNTEPYWTVRCDNPDLPGSRSGELPINPPSHNVPSGFFMGRFYGGCEYEGRRVSFRVVKIGSDQKLQFYADLLGHRELKKL